MEGPWGQILDVLINEFQAFSVVRGGTGRGGLIRGPTSLLYVGTTNAIILQTVLISDFALQGSLKSPLLGKVNSQ